MSRPVAIYLYVAMTIAFAGASQATVIDFEDNTLTEAVHLSEFQSRGFNFVLTSNGGIIVDPIADCSPDCASNGTKYHHLWSGTPLTSTTMTSVSGAPFSLFQVDLAELFTDRPAQVARTVSVDGVLSTGGTVAASFSLDGVVDSVGGLADFETFSLPAEFSGLTSVVFKPYNLSGGPNGWMALDNIHATAIPKPNTALLLGIGLAGMAARRRV